MDPRKFDKEMLTKLPPELQKDIEEGNVVAIPLAKPNMSGMWFSAILAVTLFCTATPLFVPVSAFMVVGNGLAMLGWFLAYAVTDRLSCRWQNKYLVVTGLNEGIIKMIENSLKKQEDKDRWLDGTKSDSVCLKEEGAGSDEVQGDGK